MSNGGGESGKEHGEYHGKRKFGGRDYDHAVARMSVAQICESAGFQGFQQSALDTLSDIAVRYIHNVGKIAHSYASLAGRTESSAFDIIQSLEDLGSGLGFAGASDIDRCIASSGVVRDLVNYVEEAENMPFAYSICRFPVLKDRKPTPSFLQRGEEPPDEHIPPWLPAFPDPQAYCQLKEGSEGSNGTTERETKEPGGQKREELPLLNLQQNFASNTLGEPSTLYNSKTLKAKQAAESNPFLAAPLRFREKEVSNIAHPAKRSVGADEKNFDPQKNLVTDHVPMQETCSPVVEAVKIWLHDSELRDSEQRKKKELLSQRPLIKFKIEVSRKSLGPKLDLMNLENRDLQKTSPWFREDDEKDEKKRKAGKIVKQSLGNTMEPCQL